MKKVFVIFALSVLCSTIPLGVFAGYSGGGDFELRSKLEVSKPGSDWMNYTAEDNPGNQTLSANAGDTVTFRLKVWDVTTTAAQNIVLASTITNPQYIETANIFDGTSTTNQDLDGDTVDYSVTSMNSTTGIGTFALEAVQASSSENANFESGTYTTKISGSTPDQTLIEVTITLTAADELRMIGKNNLLDKAYADEFGTTRVRILVQNPTTTTTTTVLPATGATSQPNNFWQLYLACSLLALMVVGPKAIKLFRR